MALDRLPISISHLFEIHCSTNTEAAHSIDGTSVYLTVDMLQSAASDVFGETKFSLRIVPDVDGVFQAENQGWRGRVKCNASQSESYRLREL